MDQKQKKTGRDLSDLKARLGLAKGPTGEQQAVGAPQQQARPSPVAAPQAQPVAMPPYGQVPPPGGYQLPAQPAAPVQPDVRRDPFAPAAAPAYRPAPIVDAGPLIEIPEEKKPKSKWVFVFLGISLIPLVVGWSCGRIYGGREIFNKTIDDAKLIMDDLKPVVAANEKIGNALRQAHLRVPKGQAMGYDEQMVTELEEIMSQTNIQETKTRQDKIFRTNYARMDDLAVQKLFDYYNNTLRLQMHAQEFVDHAKRDKDTIKEYHKDSSQSRNYGIVLASDEGGYYLGKLVQVGPPKCKEGQDQCRATDVEGFPVRVGSGKWSVRPGKAKKVDEIVVPIMPDEDWRQVAMGRPGYISYKQYLLEFSQVLGISNVLSRDEKELSRNLSKQANRQKIFAPL